MRCDSASPDLTSDQVRQLVKKIGGYEAVKVVLADQLVLRLHDNMIRSVLTRPATQIYHVRRWNKLRRWRFTEDDFQRLSPPPSWNLLDSQTEQTTLFEDLFRDVLVLVPYLGTAQRTFNELLWCIRERQTSWRTNPLEPVCGEIKIRTPQCKHHRGLRWEKLNLIANQGQIPNTIKTHRSLPHAGILAALSLHPEWSKLIGNSHCIPSVWLGGYELSRVVDNSALAWDLIPSISNMDGILTPNCGRGNLGLANMGVPEFVD